MIIDAHVHIGREPNEPESKYKDSLAQLLKEAKKNKVGKLVVITGDGPDSENASTEQTLELIKDLKNIYVVAGVDVSNHVNYDQLEGWLKNQKILGIKFYLGYRYFYPTDPRCKPIYELCQKYNRPIIFHAGDTLGGIIEKPKIKYAHPIHIDEVATEYPDLKIIIAHLGNPWIWSTAEVIYKNPNVYADISGLIIGKDHNNHYVKSVQRRIKELHAYVGKQKLIYGTDWDVCDMKRYIKFAKSLGFSKKDRQKLFYENAQMLFRI